MSKDNKLIEVTTADGDCHKLPEAWHVLCCTALGIDVRLPGRLAIGDYLAFGPHDRSSLELFRIVGVREVTVGEVHESEGALSLLGGEARP